MPGQEVHITSNARKDLSVGAGNVPQGTKRKSLPNAKYGDSERSE